MVAFVIHGLCEGDQCLAAQEANSLEVFLILSFGQAPPDFADNAVNLGPTRQVLYSIGMLAYGAVPQLEDCGIEHLGEELAPRTPRR